jgi:hypothetical protein
MEGGLMKHFCKGTSTKIVDEFEEKIEKMMKVCRKRVFFLDTTGPVFRNYSQLCDVANPV